MLPTGPLDVQLSLTCSSGVLLKPKLALSTDGLTLSLLGSLAKAPVPLQHILWLDFGMYEVAESAGTLLAKFDPWGWERIVRTREENSETSVFVQKGNHPMGGMLMVARDGSEVIITRLFGHLDKLLEGMMSGEQEWDMLPGLSFGSETTQPDAEGEQPDQEEPGDGEVRDDQTGPSPPTLK